MRDSSKQYMGMAEAIPVRGPSAPCCCSVHTMNFSFVILSPTCFSADSEYMKTSVFRDIRE